MSMTFPRIQMRPEGIPGILMIYGAMAGLIIHFLLVYLRLAHPYALVIPHLVIIATALLLDYRATKSVMTPMFFFSLIYAVTVLTALGLNYSVLNQTLEINALVNGSLAYLVFLAFCAIAYSLGARRQQEKRASDGHIANNLQGYFWAALILGFMGLVVRLYSFSSYSDFSILNLITNANNAYFYTRQDGRNWSAIFGEAFAVLSVVIALMYDNRASRRSMPSRILVWLGVILMFVSALLSGNKTGFFWPFIGILAIQGYYYRKISKIALLPLSVLLVLSLLYAFIWRGAFNSFAEAPDSLAEYNHFFYFTARTVTEIEPDMEYLKQAAGDLLLYPIPRVLWAAKPLELGLTRRYLQYSFISLYLPINRAFSTTGLSESWMAGGYYGIVLSGLLVGFILSWARSQLTAPRSLGTLIYAAYLYGTLYFILRVGFLNVYVYNMLFAYGLTRLLDSVFSLKPSPRHAGQVSMTLSRSE